jgi:hypothetical protein
MTVLILGITTIALFVWVLAVTRAIKTVAEEVSRSVSDGKRRFVMRSTRITPSPFT